MASKSSAAQPAPAKLKTRSEFSVTLEVAPSASSSSSWYRYEYKEAGSNWEQNAHRVDVTPGASEVVLDDLNPTSTYELPLWILKYQAVDRSLKAAYAQSSKPPKTQQLQ
ncbi:hypothetical protein BBO99_00002413 [Phytophthora kernoviae]|uniref:Fibronectin type-III domain-containing protein n=2 Tax=Phytophthora kernoviae TaxID=325452 RepID=A0A3R7NK46_9STRA|nr:hypothetical protein G195_002749 [Phytophthora kernoviae 00238/432]KAG2531936.1 hypothetical protein JM16_000608 [Phytophthora kernoviae]KAG2532264.1 hypothetical protein JM18_000682 [Phytophthora kernoviae]RLN02111.1 hypothetical protein BBI17_002238 [Phytophthora kernoviae]RLN83104.1 hypothetical protein BBO99_00002413 [Phytophthora kernoviae]